ncbi:MAG: histidyl-tRNA synthetase [Chthoniobacter sp.]|jgi:histidyl-tRNA synthetase|nr:histidyl-tRNA synthetase [Chthoniobacter sp.]
MIFSTIRDSSLFIGGSNSMNSLPGFRDFFPDECARRNYILAHWREVCRRYGFVEYDGPVLESEELFRKKSGDEIVKQLFNFVDKGERSVALRPEMTPTLARMVAARERDFKKPMKWFSMPQCFRYEKQQRGRLREFYQLNGDIIGEPSVAADAEMIALVIDVLRSFGFMENDFVVRVSDRDAWLAFLAAKNVEAARGVEFLQIVDKMERDAPEATAAKLQAFGITLEELRGFIANPGTHFEKFNELWRELSARGLSAFFQLDPTIVRGLAYYTGLVFEVFDRSKKLRALAGGGRYDNLLSDMSDGKIALPALGFGMGDVVLGELIAETPHALAKMQHWIAQRPAAQIYLVVAKEEHRATALADAQRLRDLGFRVDFPLVAAKVGKQFQTAEQLGAQVAILYGDEWPKVKFKTLATRDEFLADHDSLLHKLDELKLTVESF